MTEVPVEALHEAIRNLYDCDSRFVESVPVTDRTGTGDVVWDGVVQIFDLVGHRTAARCYAWSYATDGDRRRFVTVLHGGPIDSPANAVRAAVVSEARRIDRRPGVL